MPRKFILRRAETRDEENGSHAASSFSLCFLRKQNVTTGAAVVSGVQS